MPCMQDEGLLAALRELKRTSDVLGEGEDVELVDHVLAVLNAPQLAGAAGSGQQGEDNRIIVLPVPQ